MASTQVFVLPVRDREAETDRIKNLIKKAGCEVVCDHPPSDDIERCIEEADVLVVLICPETMNDHDVDKAIEFANRLGKRVVGIWGEGVADSILPTMINRHGDGAIVCKVDTIRSHVCAVEPMWQEPKGGPRPKPKTPRHSG